MSRTVDNRVVQMTFDSAQFDAAVQKSIESLNRMNNAVKATENGSSANLMNLTTDTSNLNTAIENVNYRFSTMGIIATTALQNITNSVVNLAKKMVSMTVSGGISRAMNLESAKFQLEGLGVSWDKISDDINYGVQDTAYGLDAAAKVASQLVASQVQIGKPMKTALRSISGVAAMTNSSYEDIGNVYTTVAGNGRLMSEQLLQLSSRGLNAAATIGEYLGKSESEVREMVSSGKIDFETFAAAMDSAFGEHAKDANKTFSGALSNMKAALGRLGAEFASPALENLRDIFNALRPVIDAVHEALMPFIDVVNGGLKSATDRTVGVLEHVTPLVKGVVNIFVAFSKVLNSVGKAFSNVFPAMSEKKFESIGEAFSKFTDKLIPSKKQSKELTHIFEGLFGVLKVGYKIFTGVAKIAGVFVNALLPIGSGALWAAGGIGEFVSQVTKFGSDAVGKTATTIANGFAYAFKTIGDALEYARKNIGSVIPKILDVFNSLSSALSNGLTSPKGLTSFIDTSVILTLPMMLNAFVKAIDKPSAMLERVIKSLNWKTVSQFSSTLSQLRVSLQMLTAKLQADALLKIAEAIGILAASMFVLSSLDPASMAKATAAISALATVLVISIKQLSAVGGGISSLFGMAAVAPYLITFSTAILILTASLTVLSGISVKDIVKGVAAIGALATIMGLLAKAMTTTSTLFKTERIMKGSSALVIFAGAILMLSKALEMVAGISGEDLERSLATVGALMGLMLIFSNLSGDIGLLNGGGMALLAGGIIVLSTALERLAVLDVGSLAKGTVVIGALLSEVAAFSLVSENLIALGAGLVVFGASMIIFSDAVKAFGSMSVETLAKGFCAMAVGLIALGAAGALMTPVVPTLLALGAAFALAGAGVLMFGSGIAVLGAGLVSVAAGITALGGAFELTQVSIVGGIRALVIGIISVFSDMMSAMAQGFITFLTTMVAGYSELLPAVSSLIGLVIEAINDNVPKLIDMLLNVLDTLITKLDEHMDNFIQCGIDIILKILKGLEEGIPRIIQGMFNVVISAVNGLADAIRENTPKVRAAALNLVTAFITSTVSFFAVHSLFKIAVDQISKFISGIKSVLGRVKSVAKSIVSNLIDALKSLPSEMLSAGKRGLEGFLKGLSNTNISKAIETAVGGLGSKILKKIRKVLGIHSPSKEFAKIGEYSGLGLVKGLNSYATKVGDASEELGNSALDSIRGAMSTASDIVSGGINASPTITPVVDLSNVIRGSKSISSLLSSRQAVGIAGNISASSSQADTIKQAVSDGVSMALNSSQSGGQDSSIDITIPLNLDAREVARATAKYSQTEINKLQTRYNRQLGVI